MDFVYPTEEQRKYLNIVNRDVSAAEKENIVRNRQNISSLINDLETGKIFFDDLGQDQVERLKKLIKDL